MKTRNWLILLALFFAIPTGWYLISPLFINKTVNEDFPTVQATEAMGIEAMGIEAMGIEAMGIEAMATEAMATEAMATEAMGIETMASKEEMADETKPMDDIPEPAKEMAAPMPEAEMTILFQGQLYDLAHHGIGTATIYQLADGSRLLRFENFEVLNGPDLHVYLTSQDPVPNTVGVELENSFDLGELKGNLGDQNYEIPTELDLSQYHSVVIWCQPFRVPFNAAPLRTP